MHQPRVASAYSDKFVVETIPQITLHIGIAHQAQRLHVIFHLLGVLVIVVLSKFKIQHNGFPAFYHYSVRTHEGVLFSAFAMARRTKQSHLAQQFPTASEPIGHFRPLSPSVVKLSLYFKGLFFCFYSSFGIIPVNYLVGIGLGSDFRQNVMTQHTGIYV